MKRFSLVIFSACLLFSSPVLGAETQTSIAKIEYAREQDLLIFFSKLSRDLVFSGNDNSKSIQRKESFEDILNKTVKEIQKTLGTQASKVRFTINILPSSRHVRQAFLEEYGKDCDYFAYYSPQKKTVYFDVNRLSKDVIIHEMSHVVVDQIFNSKASGTIHELLAQYVEKQL